MKKRRVAKSWPKHSLPEELCRKILSLLPVKSLLRFRAVSRSWRSLIDDPDFARLHLACFDNNRHPSDLFAVQDDPNGNRECALRSSKTFRINARFGSFGAQSIVSSVDGLFMIKQKKISAGEIPRLEYEFVLWNPSIRKTLNLPPSPAITYYVEEELGDVEEEYGYVPEFGFVEEFGLGFDSSIKDYKYVRFSRISTAVYTLGSNSWKRIEKECSLLFDFHNLHLGKPVCFRGYLVAPARYTLEKIPSMILFLFDLSAEVYSSTDLPGDNDPSLDVRPDGLTIADDGCSMQLVRLTTKKGSVWVLDADLGPDVKSWSWTRRYTFSLAIPMESFVSWVSWGLRFLHLKKNVEILIRSTDKVIALNLETHEQLMMRRKNVFRIWPYIESLILL